MSRRALVVASIALALVSCGVRVALRPPWVGPAGLIQKTLPGREPLGGRARDAAIRPAHENGGWVIFTAGFRIFRPKTFRSAGVEAP